MKKLICCVSAIFCLMSCVQKEQKSDLNLVDEKKFDTVIDGKQVKLYTLAAGKITMQVTNFGGRVVSLWTPDKSGKMEDIVLGFNTIGEYAAPAGERFIGPVVGRYANRIAKGQFSIDGTTYQLPINNNGQTLHGGLIGLDMVVWDVESATPTEIVLTHLSPDGTEGFPGNLKIKMTYTLTPDNDFKVVYSATTDKATVVNLSHHGMFNLKGEGNGTVIDNILTINAAKVTPVDSVLIPSGEIASLDGSPLDFRKPTVIGERIEAKDVQLKNGAGYDHNWVIDRKTEKDVELNAKIVEPASGRVMEVWSDQPGMQFYSGNFFNGKISGKSGKPYSYREAFAMETQHFPDSPNHANFPTTRLNPGETYTQTCIYKFRAE